MGFSSVSPTSSYLIKFIVNAIRMLITFKLSTVQTMCNVVVYGCAQWLGATWILTEHKS